MNLNGFQSFSLILAGPATIAHTSVLPQSQCNPAWSSESLPRTNVISLGPRDPSPEPMSFCLALGNLSQNQCKFAWSSPGPRQLVLLPQSTIPPPLLRGPPRDSSEVRATPGFQPPGTRVRPPHIYKYICKRENPEPRGTHEVYWRRRWVPGADGSIASVKNTGSIVW